MCVRFQLFTGVSLEAALLILNSVDTVEFDPFRSLPFQSWKRLPSKRLNLQLILSQGMSLVITMANGG